MTAWAILPARRVKSLCVVALEEDFRCELHQARIGPGICAGHHAKIRVIARAAGCVRWSELRSIHQIEELYPELEGGAILTSEHQPLKGGDVEVIHAVGTQGWVNSRLRSECKVRRCDETRDVKPVVKAIESGERCAFVAGGQQVWPGAGSEQCNIVDLSAA